MAKTLTVAGVAKLRATAARHEKADGGCPGLYLIVQPSGRKSWAMRFRRPSGRQGKLTLGPVDLDSKEPSAEPIMGAPLTLASARRLAAEVHRQRAQGKDVIAGKRSEAQAKAARQSRNFAGAAKEFVERHCQRENRTWKKQARLLGIDPDTLEPFRRGLAERWAERPVGEISGDDVFSVIDEARERGVPGLPRRKKDGPSEGQARLLSTVLSSMFSWLMEHRRITTNPCIGVHRPKPAASRDRVLTGNEIVAVWQAAEQERPEFGNIVKLLIVTGCRKSEVTGMRWEELSEDGSVWTIPKERTKNGRDHVVPLPLLARQIIGERKQSGYVFTTDGGRSHVTSFTKIKHRLDDHIRIPAWRIHDLRRTAATTMAELGIAPHIVEAVLNHVSGAKAGVAGVYNRAIYAEEKEAALKRWAAHIEGLLTGKTAKVVPIKGRNG